MSDVPQQNGRRWRRRREHVVFFLLIILTGLGLIAGHVYVVRERARGLIAREEAALQVLERVRDAERAFRKQEGRFAFVEDLEASGLLAGLAFGGDEGARHVVSPGYRIEVLLPSARLGQGVVAITPPGGAERPDADLSKRHFSIVARPQVPLESGARMYYIDERNDLFLNEGIVDDAGARLNPLPLTQIRQSQRLDSANVLAWQRAAEIPRPHD